MAAVAMTNKQQGHRLERLFSKRKGSSSSFRTGKKEIAAQEQIQPQFPQPSFIRPTASRMVAREESAVRLSPGRRAQSLPDQHAPTRISYAHSQRPSIASTTNLRYSPVRPAPPPLMTRRAAGVPNLQEFHFPEPPTQSGDLTPTSPTASSISPTEALHPKHRVQSIGERADFGPRRIDTPPASDPEDGSSVDDRFRKKLPPLPFNDMPTPGPSPEMTPISDTRLSNPRVSEMLNTTLYSDIQRRLDGVAASSSMRRCLSYSALGPPSSTARSDFDTILREPTLNDFLDLSDDDIAEAHPELGAGAGAGAGTPPAQLPPTPPSTASTSSATRSRGLSLLTLPPPYASRPATAAAFEAARIAARYNFDLVYVVNLWPDEMKDPMSTPTRSEAKAAMTGRLLAAYGLSAVKSPFRISAAVHSKILQGDGWIEYRNQEAKSDEFARGYACAFYTGQFSKRSSANLATASSTRRPQKHAIDRGIVFAAYRKPREDGSTSTAGVGCSKTELAAVHRDAEALVEMLIDIHAANRLRQTSSMYGLHSDETGPMPVQKAGVVA